MSGQAPTYAALLCLFASLVFGLAPALHSLKRSSKVALASAFMIENGVRW